LARILIVEDEDAIIELYSQMLELFGHSIVGVARDGEAALQALRGSAPLPDVIVLDHRMPRVTGLEVLGLLPSRASGIPIIFATADESVRSAAGERGAFAVLVKPFSMDRLVDQVARAVGAPTGNKGGGASASA